MDEKIYGIQKPFEEIYRLAVTLLNEGELVAIPTETVYGLAARADDDHAVAHIFAAKERPSFNPLIIHYASLERAQYDGIFSQKAILLAKTFWPGPLTLVVFRKELSSISHLATSGLPTMAVRVPAHPVTRSLLEHLPYPLAAPSANPFGRLSPTTPQHVLDGLGDRVSLILDGGNSQVGMESTILDMTQDSPVLLRAGGIPLEMIEKVVGKIITSSSEGVKAPGMLKSHYAPRKPLRLNVDTVSEGEGLLAFGASLKGAYLTLNLSPSGDLEEAAANFFQMLHELDASSCKAIAVMPIPERGLGHAINDRLRRAAFLTSNLAEMVGATGIEPVTPTV